MQDPITEILQENARRKAANNTTFNPITGQGSVGERVKVCVKGFPIPEQWLPKGIMEVPLISKLAASTDYKVFMRNLCDGEYTEDDSEFVFRQYVRIRSRYDFPFWAATFVLIKQKNGGEDIHFRLNRPQRKLIATFEERRLNGEPIRLILLKARQWGGSTATQIYMAWLQLVHKVGLNSLIIGHVKDAAYEVRDMFQKMITAYPLWMLHEEGDTYKPNEDKINAVGQSANIHRIPQRNCKIKIGTYIEPDSARGGDYNLVHCTEVGLWSPTDQRTPEKVVRSACSGITLKPFTMIVYESTANGTGNFFEREYVAARQGESQFTSLFVSWYEIENYAKESIPDEVAFAKALYENRHNTYSATDRAESGRYLWYLWEQGATLESIAWYIEERKKYTDHGDIASEYPTDDNEAFTYSGCKVFDKILVEKLRPACRPPRLIGDIVGNDTEGKEALQDIHFIADNTGQLCVWEKPEVSDKERITNRYLVVVDIGGRSAKADWSVICVFDRALLMDGDRPEVVAQWYGHIDMDILAWKAAQIASWYDNALLVIESNTLETKDKERMVDGDQSQFILHQIKDVYPNLYAREQSEEDIRAGAPLKYGFHTNVATKPKIIANLIKIVREHLYTERDTRCLDEMLTYEQKQNGAYGAIAGKHDDLLMTRAIGLWIAYNFNVMPIPKIIQRTLAQARLSNHIKEITEAMF